VSSAERDIEQIHCNGCLRRTQHAIIARRVQHHSEARGDETLFTWRVIYTLFECCGCRTVTLRERTICDDVDYDKTVFYPPPVSRQAPPWHSKLPDAFQHLFAEVYRALHADSRRLVLMGCRALIDMFMTTTVGDVGGFASKLSSLVSEGYLSLQHRSILEAALDAGNAATHRGHEPSADDVALVLDIVENLTQTLVLKKNIAALRRHTPRRKPPRPPRRPPAGSGDKS